MKRRDFIKNGSIAGVFAVTGTGALSLLSLKEGKEIGWAVKRHQSIDDLFEFKPDYKRFQQRNTAFNLSFWSGPNPFTPNAKIKYPTDQDTPLEELSGKGIRKPGFDSLLAGILWENKYGQNPRKTPGFTILDKALKDATCATETLTGSVFSRAFSGDSGPEITIRDNEGKLMFDMPLSLMKQHHAKGFSIEKRKWEFKTKKEASYTIKKAAKACGADLVGIAPYDERFTYQSQVYFPFDALTGKLKDGKSHPQNKFDLEREVKFFSGLDKKGKPISFEPKSVIVMAHEMDYEGYKTSPSMIYGAASSKGYAAMIEVSLKVSKFLRGIGYKTMHAGNNTGLSVPLAISAGLGEGSRMGLLVTEEFGPRVRLSKVYTDIELEYDKPKSFGVREFCELCLKYSDVCPSEAISKAKKITDSDNIVPNRSTNDGVIKWYNDSHKCLSFWIDNTIECANCVSACPYNKIEGWHHDISKTATRVPILNRFTRSMDESFGYGKVASEKNMTDYWKKTIYYRYILKQSKQIIAKYIEIRFHSTLLLFTLQGNYLNSKYNEFNLLKLNFL